MCCTISYGFYRMMPSNTTICATLLFISCNSCTVKFVIQKRLTLWTCPISSVVSKGMNWFGKLFIYFFLIIIFYYVSTGKLIKMSLRKWWHWCGPIIGKELPTGMVCALDVRLVSWWKMVDWLSTSSARMGTTAYTMTNSLAFWSSCMMRWFICFHSFVH